jgi:hypothetical protein
VWGYFKNPYTILGIIHIKYYEGKAFLNAYCNQTKGNPSGCYVAMKSLDPTSLDNFYEISIYHMHT